MFKYIQKKSVMQRQTRLHFQPSTGFFLDSILRYSIPTFNHTLPYKVWLGNGHIIEYSMNATPSKNCCLPWKLSCWSYTSQKCFKMSKWISHSIISPFPTESCWVDMTMLSNILDLNLLAEV